MEKLTYYCDNKRHLVCMPYSIENLHQMAQELNIDSCFFHLKAKKNLTHYDLPARRVKEIIPKCKLVSKFDIVRIIRGCYNP